MRQVASGPSLRGLQALQALSRTGSFRRAAEDLGITRSAVSHRIGELEAELGCRLTLREGRNSTLTDEATSLLAAMGDALWRIESAVAPFKQRNRQLRLSTVQTFAANWLLPRLHDFRQAHPEISLAVLTTQRPVDFAAEDIDCAIRHGSGDWPDLTCTFLFQETLVPVGRPSYQAVGAGAWPLIRARSRYLDWTVWQQKAAQQPSLEDGALIVENRSQALEAALAGAGVALTDLRYLQQHLAAGRLVTLGGPVTLEDGYYFVHPPSVRNHRFVEVMTQWLLHQVAAGGRMHPALC